jgi:signal transduction histidine kinase
MEPISNLAERGSVGVLNDGVTTNLLVNAAKYTPAGSPIRVEVRSGNGRIRVSVADRGPGVPREKCERIFDKFFRLES